MDQDAFEFRPVARFVLYDLLLGPPDFRQPGITVGHAARGRVAVFHEEHFRRVMRRVADERALLTVC